MKVGKRFLGILGLLGSFALLIILTGNLLLSFIAAAILFDAH
jgi:hypothetical protein